MSPAPPYDPALAEVAALLADPDPPSRNRHFARFAGRRGSRVFRLYRLYRAMAREAAELAARPGASAELVRERGGLWLMLTDPEMAYRRRSPVPPELAGFFRDCLGQGA
ncbi:MAG: hypothetical protein K9K66_10285 [Desulfarculaceae bacterium]|nr:hypothetical protein [Desulfarculaceae bacterium]MCF8073796.1 hypothetical protein [Desulfarculaceae bacterium]MCF8102037.1 hypothetical protein [Desulfarculaceae bacterium]MCF8116007.1 hypothetical protein [Desulfarculaceae bacterium]